MRKQALHHLTLSVMISRRYIPFLPILFIFLAIGCGPSQEELQRQQEQEQQARLDSLEQVWEEEMEQMRQDSLAQVEQERLEREAAESEAEEEEAEEESLEITWQTNGAFTVQVRSWRSQERAQEHANHWIDRGYPHAYVVKHGDETVGDVWFRVRLGNVGSYAMAKRLQEKIQKEHRTQSWIANSDAS